MNMATGSIASGPQAGTGRKARHTVWPSARVRAACAFLAPVAVLVTALIAAPLAGVVWNSLHHASLIDARVGGFAGLENFRTVLDDEHFLPALMHTLVWTVVSVAGEYACGLASALALARPFRGRAVVRGLIILPWVIPIAIAGVNWAWLLNPDYGVLNAWLVRAGLLTTPHDWLGHSETALLTVTLVNIWRSFPFYTISLLAALSSIPDDLYEAAALDGAGTVRRFVVITLPHVRTVSLTLIVVHVIWTAINFDFIWVMTQGGPLDATETLPILIYRYALQEFDVGLACALATLSMAAMAALFLVQAGLARARAAR
ncbi:carbohydrate ABC transporter permease [Methylobacterium mesophilicum]|nr:sugar ABC transporter permease [Methylobacterium mesophilicum]